MFKIGSGKNKLCGPLAEGRCKGEKPVREELSELSSRCLEGCC